MRHIMIRVSVVTSIAGIGLATSALPALAEGPVHTAYAKAELLTDQAPGVTPARVEFPLGGSLAVTDGGQPGSTAHLDNGTLQASGDESAGYSSASVTADSATLEAWGPSLSTILKGRLRLEFTGFTLACTAAGDQVRATMTATNATATYTPSDPRDGDPVTFDLPTNPAPNTYLERSLPGFGGTARIWLNSQESSGGKVVATAARSSFAAGGGQFARVTCGPNVSTGEVPLGSPVGLVLGALAAVVLGGIAYRRSPARR